MQVIIGISSYYHDSAAALMIDGELVGAIQNERITRIKGDSSFPTHAIRALLEIGNLKPSDVTAYAYYERPSLKLRRIIKTMLTQFPYNIGQAANISFNHEVAQYRLRKVLKENSLDHTKPLYYYEHHKSHAAAAFFGSGFADSAVLTIDGVGEMDCTSIWRGSGIDIYKLKHQVFPHSLGLLYATFTAFCGFKINSGEYKLMGLAPYGKPVYYDKIVNELVCIADNGSILLNLKYFNFARGGSMYSKHFGNLFGLLPRDPEREITPSYCDLAASIQKATVLIVKRMVDHALEITGLDKICLSGGVALNCVSNGHLARLIDPRNIFVYPASGDSGSAVGAAYLASLELSNKQIKPKALSGVYLGKAYAHEECKDALDKYGLRYVLIANKLDYAKHIANMLTNGEIVGLFQGRMEFGPRALGNRSILADARSAEMQLHLNLKTKNRESFRPFAPVILEEHVSEWLDWPHETPSEYMLFTSTLLPYLRQGKESICKNNNIYEFIKEARSPVPAVTHVDYSARFQSVGVHSPLRHILESFYEETGCPVLVNTSFNVRGEPIVESPEDAIKCFLTTGIDVLAINSFIVEKKDQSPSVHELQDLLKKEWEPD